MAERYLAWNVHNLEARLRNVERRLERKQLRELEDPFELPENAFVELYRLSPALMSDLIGLLYSQLQRDRPPGFSVEKQVLAAVRFYATGCYQRPVGEQWDISMSQSSISRSIRNVTNAINQLLLRPWVRFPMTQFERQIIRQEFGTARQPFEGAIGAIDCSHIAILAPTEHEEGYINHHGYHSLNVQMICDPNLKTLNVNARKLAGRTVFITGGSRGIGKSIALKAAKDGANVVIAAKTAEAHPKLPGTIYTAAKEIEAVGGRALPCIVDVRNEAEVHTAVENAVKQFGGIDILINNASAISLTHTLATDMKKYDLMNNVNTRGTFLVSKLCIPYLKKSLNPHIVNISPPLNLNPIWFKNHVAYTIAKYGMSMCILGMAEEFKSDNIAINAVWPKTAIHTAAIEMLTGPESKNISRKPDIMADAVYSLICKDSKSVTGQFFIDEELLRHEGIFDLTQYACNPEYKDNLMPDFFLDLDPKANDVRIETTSPTMQNRSRDEHNATSGGFGDGKVAQIFSAINENLTADLVKKTGAIFQFNVKGAEAGTWFLDLKNGNGTMGKGESMHIPDATLTMDSKHFFEMFSGNVKPAAAFMTGKLKVDGSLQKAMKLEKLMGNLKSKL